MKKRYHLLDGRRIVASERNSKDGKTVLNFRDENGNIVDYNDVIQNACYADSHEIRDWADCLADVNEKAA